MPRIREVPLKHFRAQCASLLDEVARDGIHILVTRDGKPIARIAPHNADPHGLRGSIVRTRDIVAPIRESWSADKGRRSAGPIRSNKGGRTGKRAMR